MGDLVGLNVGLVSEGAFDGSGVGSVGEVVGLHESGPSVGPTVGCCVGRVGLLVGLRVGVFVGV